MNKILISLLLAASVVAGHIAKPVMLNDIPEKLNCSANNTYFICFLTKAVTNLQDMQQLDKIEITNDVSFVRATPKETSDRSLKLSGRQILDELPQDVAGKLKKLFGMLFDSGLSFMRSYSLKFNIDENSRALEEARTKMKKIILPMLGLIGTKIFAIMPILLGGLTLTSIKAYIVSKIALVIAIVLAFQKFFGNDVLKNPQYNGWYDYSNTNWTPYNNQYPTKRSVKNVKTDVDAHNLAYAGHLTYTTGYDSNTN